MKGENQENLKFWKEYAVTEEMKILTQHFSENYSIYETMTSINESHIIDIQENQIEKQEINLELAECMEEIENKKEREEKHKLYSQRKKINKKQKKCIKEQMLWKI